MTAIDQAFIRAYTQQDPTAAAAEVDDVRKVPSAEEPASQPAEPSGQTPDEELEPAAATPPEDDSILSLNDLSAVLTGSDERPSPEGPQAADSPDPVYRVDPAATDPAATDPAATDPAANESAMADPAAAADRSTVPPPHIEPVTNGSSIAAAPPESSFRPMLQVDQFTWSKTCLRLAESAGGELDRLAESFMAAMSEGRKVLAIGSCRRGQGATTMLLCVGRRLADWGLKNVLVDADLVDPQLARRLGILPEFGLEHVLAGQMLLEEVVIESVADRLALLPIHEPFTGADAPPGDRTRFAEALDTLTANYNLVLIDPGPLQGRQGIDGPLADVLTDRLDAVMLVYDASVASQQRLADVQRSLAETGIVQAGIIENFVRA